MDKKLYAGIDLGGTDIKGGLVEDSGRIIDEERIPTEAGKGPSHVLERMVKIITVLRERNADREVAGAGVGVPGQVLVEEGLLVEAPNLKDWHNIHVADEMQKRLDIPVIVDNDANVAALGEYRYGAGKGCRNMLMVTLGTGVGGGLILNGEVYRGAAGGAGEFGHIVVRRGGAVCTCGRRGCVEAYVGSGGILRILREKLDAGEESLLRDRDTDILTPKDISRAAEQGDRTARRVLAEAGEWLSVGIGSVANLLNIERAVIGGGVSAAGDLILKPLQEALPETALKVSLDSLEVVPAQLGNKAGLAGAASLVIMAGE